MSSNISAHKHSPYQTAATFLVHARTKWFHGSVTALANNADADTKN